LVAVGVDLATNRVNQGEGDFGALFFCSVPRVPDSPGPNPDSFRVRVEHRQVTHSASAPGVDSPALRHGQSGPQVRTVRSSCFGHEQNVFPKFGFAVFERRTVRATMADCPQFIFQQRTESVPVTVLRRILPPDSPLVLHGQSAAVSLAQVRSLFPVCVFLGL
jgi:hypothetical protein